MPAQFNRIIIQNAKKFQIVRISGVGKKYIFEQEIFSDKRIFSRSTLGPSH